MNRIKIILAILATVTFVTTSHAKDGDIISKGNILAISSSMVTVLNSTYILTSSTEYEDAIGNKISPSAFTLGDYVKVKGYLASGMLIARELEFEDDNDDDSSKGNGKGKGKKDSNDSHKSSKSKNKLKVKLSRVNNASPFVHGKLQYREKVSKNKEEERLWGGVKIPLSSTVPAVGSVEEAASLLIIGTLSRSGIPYAECQFVFDELEEDDHNGEINTFAEYKLDIRSKIKDGEEDLRIKKGNCDVDLLTAGTQSGVPAVEDEDTIDVSENSVVFLTGTF